jgi:hypothetical protein
MDLGTIIAYHDAFSTFLSSSGKDEHIRKIDLDDFARFLSKVLTWNKDNSTDQITKIGIYNTLNPTNDVRSYLVGLNDAGEPVIGGGGGGDGPPFHP